MYVECDNLVCSCNQFCPGNALSSTYSDSMKLALVTQYAMAMRRIVICGLPGSTISFHIISQMARV